MSEDTFRNLADIPAESLALAAVRIQNDRLQRDVAIAGGVGTAVPLVLVGGILIAPELAAAGTSAQVFALANAFRINQAGIFVLEVAAGDALGGASVTGGLVVAGTAARELAENTPEFVSVGGRIFNTLTGREVNAAGEVIEGGARLTVEAADASDDGASLLLRVVDDAPRGGASSGGADDAGRQAGQIIGQLTENSCGPACLQTLLREGGEEVFQSQLANLANMNGGVLGTTPQGLANAANTILEDTVFSSGVFDLIDDVGGFGAFISQGPFIALLDTATSRTGHFVVVRGLDETGRVIVDNPANGGFREVIEQTEFIRRWADRGGFGPFVRGANGG